MVIPKATTQDAVKAVLIVFLGLSIMALFLLVLGGNWFWEKHDTYYVKFVNARDLVPGRLVRFAGIQVGRVRAVSLDQERPTDVTVELGIQRGFAVRDGVVASIGTRGVVGESFVSLELQHEPGDKLPPGSWLPAKDSPGLMDIAGNVSGTLADLRPRLDRIAGHLEELISPENLGQLKEILANLAEVTGRENRALVRDTLKAAPKVLERTGKAVAGIEAEARTLSGNAGKTLNESRGAVKTSGEELTKTLAETRRLLEEARGLAETAKSGLAFDQERVEDILASLDRTSADLGSLARTLRERPWLLLRPSAGPSGGHP